MSFITLANGTRLNADRIECYRRMHAGTDVQFVGQWKVTVDETPDQLDALISAAEYSAAYLAADAAADVAATRL